MALLDHYHAMVDSAGYQSDALQIQAIEMLQTINDALIKQPKSRVKWLPGVKLNKADPVKGLYLWGGVGRGKTLIMDIFFDHLQTYYKKRVHFNHFMRYVHQQINQLKGKPKPIDKIAFKLAGSIRVLCFDELYVEDVADAMILGDLFKCLFNNGITIIATSNTKPDHLYAGGLQRQSFLPAIEAIKKHMRELNLDSGQDYRSLNSNEGSRFFYPLSGQQNWMYDQFHHIVTDEYLQNSYFFLEGRQIQALAQAEHAIWFDFMQICGYGRGVNDYIEIANRFDYVFISNVPVFDGTNDNEAKRFIRLIDEFYDRQVGVFISAAADVMHLYQGDYLAKEFQRTQSRINEMQSQHYKQS